MTATHLTDEQLEALDISAEWNGESDMHSAIAELRALREQAAWAEGHYSAQRTIIQTQDSTIARLRDEVAEAARLLRFGAPYVFGWQHEPGWFDRSEQKQWRIAADAWLAAHPAEPTADYSMDAQRERSAERLRDAEMTPEQLAELTEAAHKAQRGHDDV